MSGLFYVTRLVYATKLIPLTTDRAWAVSRPT